MAFENHPSIKNIKSKKFNSTFVFENTCTVVVLKVISNINVAKSCQVNIPTKIIEGYYIFAKLHYEPLQLLYCLW